MLKETKGNMNTVQILYQELYKRNCLILVNIDKLINMLTWLIQTVDWAKHVSKIILRDIQKRNP